MSSEFLTDREIIDAEQDCSKCDGLCCKVFKLTTKDGQFGHEKACGEDCKYLQEDNRCSIHETLIKNGYPGCAQWWCAGAGPVMTAYMKHHGIDPHRSDARYADILDSMRWEKNFMQDRTPCRKPENHIATIRALLAKLTES